MRLAEVILPAFFGIAFKGKGLLPKFLRNVYFFSVILLW